MRRTTCTHEVVQLGGNPRALGLVDHFFTPAASVWRGLGEIEASGYALRPAYAGFDAGPWQSGGTCEARDGCLCGQVNHGPG